jgi:hypothetical protein
MADLLQDARLVGRILIGRAGAGIGNKFMLVCLNIDTIDMS